MNEIRWHVWLAKDGVWMNNKRWIVRKPFAAPYRAPCVQKKPKTRKAKSWNMFGWCQCWFTFFFVNGNNYLVRNLCRDISLNFFENWFSSLNNIKILAVVSVGCFPSFVKRMRVITNKQCKRRRRKHMKQRDVITFIYDCLWWPKAIRSAQCVWNALRELNSDTNYCYSFTLARTSHS